jgi:hypothetical protein
MLYRSKTERVLCLLMAVAIRPGTVQRGEVVVESDRLQGESVAADRGLAGGDEVDGGCL